MSNAAKAEVIPVHQQVPTAHTPMDLLNQAVASGNIELAEKLMGLHERWEANQARKAFDAAISTAKAAIPAIVRNREGHNKKTYADFAAIARTVDPIISQHGLGYRFSSDQTDGRIAVTCVLFHRDGHSEKTTLVGPADTSGNKNAIQAIGSTLTYLQRYSLVQMLGLAAADDDDGKAGGAGDKISEDELKHVQSLIVEVAADIQKFCKYMKVERIEDIPADGYARAVNALEAKRSK